MRPSACTTPTPTARRSTRASCACDPAAGREGAPRFAVELDSTAFYPTSGGQPFDIGTLGGARVLDVVDEDDGASFTHLDRGPLAEGIAVSGADRLGPPLRPHAAAHRPARAVGGVRPPLRQSDRELSPRRRVVHDRSRPRGHGRARSRRPWTKPTASCGRTGRCRVRFVTRPRRRRRCRCARSRPATGTLRLIEVEDFDSVGLRRHPRGAHRWRRHHRRRRLGAVPRRLARVQFLCGVRVRRAVRRLARCLGQPRRSTCRWRPTSWRPRDRTAAGREQGAFSARCAARTKSWPCTRRPRSWRAATRAGDRLVVVEALARPGRGGVEGHGCGRGR